VKRKKKRKERETEDEDNFFVAISKKREKLRKEK